MLKKAVVAAAALGAAGCAPADNGTPTLPLFNVDPDSVQIVDCTDPSEGATVTCIPDADAEPDVRTRTVEDEMGAVREVVLVTIEDGDDNLVEVVANQLAADRLLEEDGRLYVAAGAVDESSSAQPLDVRTYVTAANGEGFGPSTEITAEDSFPDTAGWLNAADLAPAYVTDVTDDLGSPMIFRIQVGGEGASTDNPPTQVGSSVDGDDDDSASPSR